MKYAKIALVLIGFVAMVGMVTHTQAQVFVPGNASGYFGNPVD